MTDRQVGVSPSRRGLTWAALGVALTLGGCWALKQTGALNDASEPPPPEPEPVVVRRAEQPGFVLGYNLDYPGDWTAQPPFIDQMKNSRALTGSCEPDECDATRHLNLDANGWPRSLQFVDDPARAYTRIETYLNSSEERYDLGQRFVVTWEGEGDVDLFGAEVLEESTRRLEFELGPVLVVRLYPRGSGLRNVRVFRADLEKNLLAGEVFNPDLIDFLRPFRSLRFMDWMQSNAPGRCRGGPRDAEECDSSGERGCPGGSCAMPQRFSERPLSGRRSWLSWGQFLNPARPGLGLRVGGYPVEVMVALANEAKASPHFNMPLLFDDDYVRQFARVVLAELNPELVVRVEYSNEVWNWGFSQATYAKQQAERLLPGEGSGWVQFMAGRTRRMCQLWREVFAGQDKRLQCLIAPQTGWRELVTDVLDCPAWRKTSAGGGPCHEPADAIAVSGYFSGCLHQNPEVLRGWLKRGQAVALDYAFDQLNHGGRIDDCEDNLDHTVEEYQFLQKLARERGLGLVVYEGGTHFEYTPQAEHDSVHELLVAMTRDPRMASAYQRNWAGFERAGGKVFNMWGWIAKNDTWANAETLADRRHTKYRAALEFLAR